MLLGDDFAAVAAVAGRTAETVFILRLAAPLDAATGVAAAAERAGRAEPADGLFFAGGSDTLFVPRGLAGAFAD